MTPGLPEILRLATGKAQLHCHSTCESSAPHTRLVDFFPLFGCWRDAAQAKPARRLRREIAKRFAVFDPWRTHVYAATFARAPGHCHAQNGSMAEDTLHVNQPQADLDGLVDLGHRAGVNHPQTIDQSLPVHGSDLVQAYCGAGIKTIGAGRFNHSFHGIRQRGNLGGDGCHNRQRAVTIADVILDDQSRPGLPDLVSHSGVKGDQIDFAALDVGYFLPLRLV